MTAGPASRQDQTARGIDQRAQRRPMMVNNRWFQLTGLLVAMVMIANLQYAWTLFVRPIQQAHGWTLPDVQWAFTLFILCQTWMQPLQGWFIDRMGPRIFFSAAAVLCTVGWAGLGYATTLPTFYALYSAAGIGAALVYGGAIGSALKWFQERRGLASGIMAAGFGGGAAIFIPVIAYTIRSYGYQVAFVWTGLFQGLVILIVAQYLRHPPRDAVTTPPQAPTKPRVGAHHFTTGEMLRTPHFYMLYIMFVLMSTGGLMVTANAGPIAQSWGITMAALTLATALSPLANGASRIFWGWASDRLGRENTMTIAFGLQACCLLLVLTLGRLSGGWFAFTLVLTYFTWGEIFALFPSTLGDYFGTRHSTSNYSVLYTAKGVASIVGGGLAAILFEWFGSWSAAIYGSAVLALVAATMPLALRAWTLPAMPRRVASAVQTRVASGGRETIGHE